MRKGSLRATVAVLALDCAVSASMASPLRLDELGLDAYHEVSVTVPNSPNDAIPLTTKTDYGYELPPAAPPNDYLGLLTRSTASPLARSASVMQETSQPFWQKCVPPDDPDIALRCAAGQPVWRATSDFHFSTAGQADVVNAGLTLRAIGNASYVESPKAPGGLNQGVNVSTDAWSVFHFRLVSDPGALGVGTSLLNWSGHIDLTKTSSGGIAPNVEADVQLVISDSSGLRQWRVTDGAFSFSEWVSPGAEFWMGVGLGVFYGAIGTGGGTELAASWDAGVYTDSLTVDGLAPRLIGTASNPVGGSGPEVVVPEPTALLMLSVGLVTLWSVRRGKCLQPAGR